MDFKQSLRDGVRKVSEAVFDTLVSNIIDNQQEHLSHLQEMQKWGIVKLAQKFTSSRYLHRKPLAIPVPEVSLIRLFDFRAFWRSLNFASSPPRVVQAVQSLTTKRFGVGTLTADVKAARCILLGNPAGTTESRSQTLEWRVVIRCDGVEATTQQPVFLTRQSEVETARGEDDDKAEDRSAKTVSRSTGEGGRWTLLKGDSGSSTGALGFPKLKFHSTAPLDPFHALEWKGEHLELPEIGDLWADICIDLEWRKTGGDSESEGGSGGHESDTGGENADARRDGYWYESFTMRKAGARKEAATPVVEVLTPTDADPAEPTTSPNAFTLLKEPFAAAKRTSWLTTSKVSDKEVLKVADNTTNVGVSSSVEMGRSKAQKLEHRGTMDPARRRLPSENEPWQIYGRVMVPLTTFLSCYGADFANSHKRFKEVGSQLLGLNTRVQESSSLWFHIYPHMKEERKYYRPIAGYLGFGMVSPRTTLGFLNITLQFKFSSSVYAPLLAPLLSVANSPDLRWTTAMTVEPQYLEAYGLRALHLITTLPRWVPKFFQPTANVTRNEADYLCITFFWIFLCYALLWASLLQVPLCLFALAFAVSLSYRFGVHQIPPARSATLYRSTDHDRDHDDDDNETTSPKGSSGNLTLPLSSKGLPKCPAQWSEFRGWGSVLRLDEYRKLDAMQHQILKPSSPRSPGAGKSCLLETPRQFSMTTKHRGILNLPDDEGLEPPTAAIGLGNSPRVTFFQGGATPSGASPLESQRLPPIPTNGKDCFVSVVRSPYGLLAACVRDPTSYWPRFPVYSDDAGEQDLSLMLENGLIMLDGVQRMAGFTSHVLEKLKSSINWEDPFSTFSSLFVFLCTALFITLTLAILRLLPSWIARTPLLTPILCFISLTDPWLRSQVWTPFVGLDPQDLWLSLFTRTPVGKHRRDPPLTPAAGGAASGTPSPLQDSSQQQVPSLPRLTSPTSTADAALLPEGSGVPTFTPSGCQSLIDQSLSTRWASTVRESLVKRFSSFNRSKKVSEEPMTLLEKREDLSKGLKERVPFSPVRVLKVKASTAVCSTSPSSKHRKLYLSLSRPLVKQLLWLWKRIIVRLIYRRFIINYLLWHILVPTIATLAFGLLGLTDFTFRFLIHWWLRLPERREFEHRQIAATQFVGNSLSILDARLAADDGDASDPGATTTLLGITKPDLPSNFDDPSNPEDQHLEELPTAASFAAKTFGKAQMLAMQLFADKAISNGSAGESGTLSSMTEKTARRILLLQPPAFTKTEKVTTCGAKTDRPKNTLPTLIGSWSCKSSRLIS